MILKTRKLLWNILFSNQKSGVLRDLGPLFLLQKVKSTCKGVSHLVKFQAATLDLY